MSARGRRRQLDFVDDALAALHAAALAAGAGGMVPGQANYLAHLHGIESPPGCTRKPCRLGGICLALYELTQHKNEVQNRAMAAVHAANEAASLSAALDRYLVALAPILQSVHDAHRRVSFHDHMVCLGTAGVLAAAIELAAELRTFEATVRSLVWSRELQQPAGKTPSELLLTAVYQHLRWGGFKYDEIEALVLGKRRKGAAERVRARVKAPNARSLMPYEAEKSARAIPPPDKATRGGHAHPRR